MADRFAEAAAEAGATVHRTHLDAATGTVRDLLIEPAVGTALDGDLALPEEVETDPSVEAIEAASTGVTGTPLGIADYGTVVIAPDRGDEGPISLYPERQIVVVRQSDLVSGVGEALAELADRFEAGADDAVLVTGPSSTGDMGELVTGVHGPAELHVVLVED